MGFDHSRKIGFGIAELPYVLQSLEKREIESEIPAEIRCVAVGICIFRCQTAAKIPRLLSRCTHLR